MSERVHTRIAVCLALATALAPMTAVAQPRRGASGLEQFRKMGPEERRRLLENIPPERRKQIQERLDRYEKMPPAEKALLERRYERFRALSPDKQESLRRTWRRFMEFPAERRAELRQEWPVLRGMTKEERDAWMSSEEFRARYSSEEREVLEELSGLLEPP